MKRKLLFLLILVISSTATKAQGIYFGFELGGNIIPIQKNDLGTEFRIGPYVGGNVRYDLTKNISISSGLFFSQRKKMYFNSDTSSVLSAFDQLLSFSGGATNTDSLLNIPGVDMNVYKNTKGMATENYIEIPLMVTYNYQNFSFQVGPYIGFLMNGKRKEQIRTTTPLFQAVDIASFDSTGLFSAFFPPADEIVFDESSNIDTYKRFDVGFSAGIGYTMDKVKFKLNYTSGFNDYRIDRGLENKSTHKSIRISVVYFFNSKKVDSMPSL